MGSRLGHGMKVRRCGGVVLVTFRQSAEDVFGLFSDKMSILTLRPESD